MNQLDSIDGKCTICDSELMDTDTLFCLYHRSRYQDFIKYLTDNGKYVGDNEKAVLNSFIINERTNKGGNFKW